MLSLNLSPVSVLIGRSGTGKSNIVQAMRFVRNYLLDPESAISFEGGWQNLLPIGGKGRKPVIMLTFRLPGENEPYAYTLGFKQLQESNVRLALERLVHGNQTLFQLGLDPNNNWAWVKRPDAPFQDSNLNRPVLGAFPSIQQLVFANTALTHGLGYYHFPPTSLKAVGNLPPFLQSFPGLFDDASNFLAVMRAIAQDFHHPEIRKNILENLRKVNPSVASIELDSIKGPQKAVVSHSIRGLNSQLDLGQESDGFRRFYAHLLALYQTPPKLTSVFEEPENAIFPGALSLLADEFIAAPKEKRGQIIITTHSPILLGSFDVESIVAVDMKDGETIAGSIAENQRRSIHEHLLTTGELLTVEDPQIVEQPPRAQ